MKTEQIIAEALVGIGAVGFAFEPPITFKSGILSPTYIDNRTFPAHPTEWKHVIEGFAAVIARNKLQFDYIAGIETAGIPHSAALGFFLQKPSVFVRKASKDHGTKKMVEGGSVSNKTVLLIEDHVTTGLSSLTGVQSLRAAGATVTDCLSITSFEMPEAVEQFAQAGVRLHTLTTFSHILKVAVAKKTITTAQSIMVNAWLADPHAWSNKHKQ